MTHLDLRGSVPDPGATGAGAGAPLEELPKDIARLTSLVHLDVSNNALKSLPPLDALTKLEVLDARGNRLERMPSFETLTALREAYFGKNRLEHIDKHFAWMKKLERLELHENRIQYMPFGFKPSSLVDLQVGDNELSAQCEPNCGFIWTAVRHIFASKTLVRLGIDAYLLKAPDDYFASAKKLREVDVYMGTSGRDDLTDDHKSALARLLPKAKFNYGLRKADGPRLVAPLADAAAPKPAKKKSGPAKTKGARSARAPEAPTRARKPALDPKDLATPEGRERALDAVGRWFVEEVVHAGSDDAAARSAMEGAIEAFYDIREAADQERGEYAGHFFRVDAVGLENTGRVVPWTELTSRVGSARAQALADLFDEAEAAST